MRELTEIRIAGPLHHANLVGKSVNSGLYSALGSARSTAQINCLIKRWTLSVLFCDVEPRYGPQRKAEKVGYLNLKWRFL